MTGDKLLRTGRYRQVVEQLKSIPHLRLACLVPIESIREEIEREVDEYVRVRLNGEARGFAPGEFRREWYGRGLIDYLPDSRQLHEFIALPEGSVRRREDGSLILHSTELAASMPVTMGFFATLARAIGVCRILRLPAGGELPWHSHARFKMRAPLPYDKLVLQIPVWTNDQVVYRVAAYGKTDAQVWEQSYESGEAWVFNGWHEHEVVNRSSQDRITLYMETSIADPILFPLLERSLALYKGPVIDVSVSGDCEYGVRKGS